MYQKHVNAVNLLQSGEQHLKKQQQQQQMNNNNTLTLTVITDFKCQQHTPGFCHMHPALLLCSKIICTAVIFATFPCCLQMLSRIKKIISPHPMLHYPFSLVFSPAVIQAPAELWRCLLHPAKHLPL